MCVGCFLLEKIIETVSLDQAVVKGQARDKAALMEVHDKKPKEVICLLL